MTDFYRQSLPSTGDGILFRLIWGFLGGAIATASKFLGQDFHWYRVFKATKDFEAIEGMVSIYILLFVLLVFIGAVVAAAFQGERHPMKLLWLGVAAPALVTTWLGGQYSGEYGKGSSTRAASFFSLVSDAYAADKMEPSSNSFWRGAGIVFGVGKDQTKYRVVVGSYPDRAQAATMLEKARKNLPADLNVFAADPKPGNQFYGVVVGKDLSFNEAQKLRDSVSEQLGISDAYLSRVSN